MSAVQPPPSSRQAASLFQPSAMETLRSSWRLDRQDIRKLRNRLLKHFVADEVALSDFPAREQIALHPLRLFRRVDSSIDGATKLLFETQSGLLIESVILRIATGRTTLCVSSQIGCAAACDFCATGKMGIAKNLTVDEILDQVLQAGQLLQTENRRLNNIVFMGMGEPLHNEVNVTNAIDLLTAPDHFARSPSSLLVSTVGIPDAMLRIAHSSPGVNLALSLHSVDQTVRESIIPLAKRATLDQLHATIANINGIQNREFMIEYLMLSGVNDSIHDARRLIGWLAGLRVHVNLIPYNRIEAAPHLSASPAKVIDVFAAELKAAGRKTTTRYSLGQDIDAACGQLIRDENRQRARRVAVSNLGQ